MKKAVLFTHLDPVIHGQAMMGNLLLRGSDHWRNWQISPINAVYDEDRSRLRVFSWQKIVRFWQYLLELHDVVREKKVDIVITTFAFFPGPFLKDCALVFFTRWILRCHVLVWVHMDPNRLDLKTKPRWFSLIAKWLVRSIDGWVACAPTLSQSWPEWMKTKPIHEIANGIMDPAPQADQLATPGKHDKIRVVYISVLDEEKGWRELFSAAETICHEHSNVEFIFRGTVGINQNETEVRGKFDSSLFPERIRFEGPVSGKEKSDLLRSADIFCLPSWTEAFPLAVLDAMAYGLPCLVTNVGAIREAIREGQEGCFFEPTNTHSLTSALNRMISDRDGLERMGRSARLRFKEHFTSEAFADQWHQLLNSFQKRTS